MATTPPPVTILNVDDHEISRYAKSRMLRQAGFEVKEAITGYQTLQMIRQDHPPLVLLDINLPDISGLEVCRRIKSDPALALTLVLQISASLVTSTDKARGLEGGADAYLSEPVEPEELVATVKALLRLRQAEAMLEAQQLFLRQVIDLNPNLIFAKDRQGRFTLVNRAVAEVYGVSVQNLIGKTDADFSANPAEVEHFRADDLEVMDTLQEKFIPEETITDATGQVRWLQTVKRPIIGEDGLAHQILGVATDITPRKQIQAELVRLNETLEQRVSERTALIQLLQEIAATANEAEMVEEALQFTLDRICTYTGWPVGHVYWLAEEGARKLIPSSIWHLNGPERFEAFRRVTEDTRLTAGVGIPGQVLASGELTWMRDVTQEANFARREAAAQSGLKAGFGFPVWAGQDIVAVLEFYSTEAAEPDGAFLEAVTQLGTQLGRVVERVRAEKEIRERERQLAEAQQIAHLGSWQWNIVTNQVSWSDEMYRIYGLEPQCVAITYEDFLERIHPDDRERVAGIVAVAYESGLPFDYEHRLTRPDGAIRTIYAQGRVVWDETGRPVKMVGTGHDITERKEIEEQLRRLNAELEQRVIERTAQLEAANQELAEEITERKRAELGERLLAEAGKILTSSLEPNLRLSSVAQLAVPELADWCAVTLFKEDWSVRHLAVAHVDPAKVELAYEMQRRYPARQAELAKMAQPWQHGQAQLYPEITEAMLEAGAQDAEHYQYMRDLNMQSAMVVPLVVRDRVMGVMLFVWAESGRRYDEHDLALAKELARRAASALENARAYEAERRARAEAETAGERLSLLAMVSEVLISSPDYETALANLAHLLVPSLADWCVVDVIGEDGMIRRLAVVHRDPAKADLAAQLQHRYPALNPQSKHTVARTLRQGRSWFDAEVAEARLAAEARDAEHLQLLQELGFASEMVVPLMARGRTLGALTFVRSTLERRYGPADLILAEELARRAALAIDNAHLYQAEQRARQAAEETAERITTLQTITAAFSEALTPAQVVRVIIDQGLTILGAEGSVVALLDKNGTILETLDFVGYPTEMAEKWHSYPITAAAPLPDAVRTETPVFVESLEALTARYPHLMIQRPVSYQALAAVPLTVEGRVLGGWGLSFVKPQAFDPEDRTFILALAQQCAQALERARLYEVEQQARIEAEEAQRRTALLAEMRERNRLAQELHDTVAQTLGYVNLKIGLTHTLLADNQVQAAEANLQELKQIVGEVYTDVREEIFNLRAKVLSGLSFREVLDRYIEKYRRFYNLDIQLVQEADPAVFEFPAEVTPQIIRTIQEALINIRKHAQVNRAIIRLAQVNGHIRITIEDQGQGFDPAKIKGKTSSFGLQIMRERVESVGGTLEIDTAPGQGTRVILHYK